MDDLKLRRTVLIVLVYSALFLYLIHGVLNYLAPMIGIYEQFQWYDYLMFMGVFALLLFLFCLAASFALTVCSLLAKAILNYIGLRESSSEFASSNNFFAQSYLSVLILILIVMPFFVIGKFPQVFPVETALLELIKSFFAK